MGSLRVGFVLDDTLDTPDGVQQYVLTLGNWLTTQGHEVHYLVGATRRNDIQNIHVLSKNISVNYNGNRMSTPLPASTRKIKKLLARLQLDVLHVQMPYSPFMAAKVVLSASKNTAVVGTFHIAPHSQSVVRGNKVLARLLTTSLKRFDSVFCVSAAAASFARTAYAVEASILPNVVKVGAFKSAEPFSVTLAEPTVVFLGRLVQRKGCQVFLEAVSLLKQDTGTTLPRVIICGRGPLDKELKAFVRSSGIADTVTFTGFVSDADKARYLKSADVAVFPSSGGESFGIVLLEAMAAENPVVLGADNDGYRTVLEPYSKLLFPVNDPEQLAAKLKVFLTDNEERLQALNWQQSYIRQFDVAIVGPRLVARYDQALRTSRKS